MDQNRKRFFTIGYTMLLTGLVGLAWPLLSLGFLGDFAFLNEAENDYGHLPLGDNSFIIGSFSPTPKPDYEASDIKNRLIMEKVDINMALIVSEHARTLFKGGWVFTNSPTPETGDNMIIFGHRFRYLPPVSNTLYSLDKMAEGDEFKIIWNGKTYKYKVTNIKIIEPDDLSILNHSKKPIVTIVTCSPLFSTEKRLVLTGEML